MKIFNVSFVDSSFTRNVLFNIGSNNIVLLSEVKYANFHYAMFENQENFGIILSAGENNSIAMNDIHVANSSFASPVTHFIFNNLNTINLTRIFVSDNIYLLSDSSVFDLEDTNVFQMNNSLFQNLDFLNQATFFERSMLFSFRVFNVIEFFNNSFTNLVGLGHLVVLFDFNSFYDVQTKCQNINVTVISPDVNNPYDNGGYIYAGSDNYLGLELLVLENVTLISQPKDFAVFGFVEANNTVYLMNVTVINENNDQILWKSGSGNNTFILDNLFLVNSEATYDPQEILYSQDSDEVVSLSGSVSAFDYNHNPSRGLYFNSTDKEFSLCEMGCLNCDESGCSLCSGALILQNGHCECPEGFFLAFDTCVSCNAHCLSCMDSLDCDVCEMGFDLELNGICSLDAVSSISFSLDSVVIQWTTTAKIVTYVSFTISNETVEEIDQRCVVQNNGFVVSENLSTVLLNVSFTQIALCGNMSEDLNFTYYNFKVNAFEGEKVKTEDYHFALQKVAYLSRLELGKGSWLNLVLVFAFLVFAAFFIYRFYQHLKAKGFTLGKKRILTFNQEMHQPLRV